MEETDRRVKIESWIQAPCRAHINIAWTCMFRNETDEAVVSKRRTHSMFNSDDAFRCYAMETPG